jgi:hypothetical protein
VPKWGKLAPKCPHLVCGVGKEKLRELEEVDVVLFQDFKPGLTHAVWSQTRAQSVVRLNQGLRGRERMPEGWSLTRKVLHHAKAGGVTNGTLTVFVATRCGSEGTTS